MAEVLLDSGPDSVNELRTLLGDPRHPQRRRLIVVVLGELRAFEAVPELTAALRDADDELCARACHALGKIGDPESAEPLAAVAMDGARPWFVRTAAAGACGQIGDPRTAGTLVEALDSEEWYPRNAAATRAGPARGRRRRRRLQPRRRARARVDRALLGPARRRRRAPRRSSSAPRAASAGSAASSPPRRAPGRPPGSRSSPGATTATGRYATMVLAPAAPAPDAPGGGAGVMHDVFSVINHIVLAYFVLLLGSYSAVTLLSWLQVRRYYRRLVHARLQRSVRSQLTPPISICAPAYNEAEVIVDAMRSMLGLRYPGARGRAHQRRLDRRHARPADRGVLDVPRRPARAPAHPVRARARRVALAHPLQPRRRRQGERRQAPTRSTPRSTSRATRWSAASTPTRCSSRRRS